jgi:uncharacterized protein YqgC (DUF456 family)
MKYWHVWFDANKQKYQLNGSNFAEVANNQMCFTSLAVFTVFDMAYDYVTKLNGSQHLGQTYSRWTVNR